MTIDMHPPANQRCQIYSEATSVRCISQGTHWEKWGGTCQLPHALGHDPACETDFYSWECDGPHLYGETDSAAVPAQREAA